MYVATTKHTTESLRHVCFETATDFNEGQGQGQKQSQSLPLSPAGFYLGLALGLSLDLGLDLIQIHCRLKIHMLLRTVVYFEVAMHT